jgi:hypothetical protein
MKMTEPAVKPAEPKTKPSPTRESPKTKPQKGDPWTVPAPKVNPTPKGLKKRSSEEERKEESGKHNGGVINA